LLFCELQGLQTPISFWDFEATVLNNVLRSSLFHKSQNNIIKHSMKCYSSFHSASENSFKLMTRLCK